MPRLSDRSCKASVVSALAQGVVLHAANRNFPVCRTSADTPTKNAHTGLDMAAPSCIRTYLEQIAGDVASGISTEHTHRPALKALLESLAEVRATNEPTTIPPRR